MTQGTTQAAYDALDQELRAVADTAAQAIHAATDPAAEPPGPEVLAQTVSAAVISGHPLTAVAAAEDIGRRLAGESLRPEAIKRLKSTAAKKQQADQAVRDAVTYAAAINLPVREIAAILDVATGTVRRLLNPPTEANTSGEQLEDEPRHADALAEREMTAA